MFSNQAARVEASMPTIAGSLRASVKLADLLQIMKQIDSVCLASYRVTPRSRLLVWMKINSNV